MADNIKSWRGSRGRGSRGRGSRGRGSRGRGGRGRGGQTNKQKCLTSKLNVIEKALKTVCKHGGSISFEDLEAKVGKISPDLESFEYMISHLDHEYYHFNLVDHEDGSTDVQVFTQVKICASYQKNGECRKGDTCSDLHLCGYVATGSFCWFEGNCSKTHHYRSDHNKQVLRNFKIAFLSQEQASVLFRWAWPHFTVPDFCGKYRSNTGCGKHNCRFLHLCKNHVMETCKFGARCKFDHDIYHDGSNTQLLKHFGIRLGSSSDDIIRLIKERHEGFYRPDVEVLQAECVKTESEYSFGEHSGEEESQYSQENSSDDDRESIVSSSTNELYQGAASNTRQRHRHRHRGRRRDYNRRKKEECLTSKSSVAERSLQVVCQNGGSISAQEREYSQEEGSDIEEREYSQKEGSDTDAREYSQEEGSDSEEREYSQKEGSDDEESDRQKEDRYHGKGFSSTNKSYQRTSQSKIMKDSNARKRYHYRRRRHNHNRRKKQECLTSKSIVIEKTLQVVCQNGGRISVEDLKEKVGKISPDLGSLENIISDLDHENYHFKFIDYEDGNVDIEVYTQVNICQTYQKNECTDDCTDLHLCGYFATGSCCWFGRQSCRKSHDFRSDYNNQVLKNFGIAFLRHEELKTLLRWKCPQFTVPEFCGQYRGNMGCGKERCRFLHICRTFVMETCSYGKRCKFAHDIYQIESNVELLNRFQISLDYSSDDVIRLIKERHQEIYRPDLEILQSDGEDNQCSQEECIDEEESPEISPPISPILNTHRDFVSQEYSRRDTFTHKPEQMVRQTSSKHNFAPFKSNVQDMPKSSSVMTAAKPSTQYVASNQIQQKSYQVQPLPSTKGEKITQHAPYQIQENVQDILKKSSVMTAAKPSTQYGASNQIQQKSYQVQPLPSTKGEMITQHAPYQKQDNFQEKQMSSVMTAVKPLQYDIATNLLEEKSVIQSAFVSTSQVQPLYSSRSNEERNTYTYTYSLSPKIPLTNLNFQVDSAKQVQSLPSNKKETGIAKFTKGPIQVKMREICKDYLKGNCSSGSMCQRMHSDLPYQWQMSINDRWVDFDDRSNLKVEEGFCGEITDCPQFPVNTIMDVCFDSMLASDGLDLISVERLEVKGDEDVSDAYLVSPWSWYWQDECGKWIEYSEQNTKQSARSDKESSDFESLFKAYKNENGSSSVKFKAGNQNYTLDFSAMSQTNDRYHTRRSVCRRPVRQIKPKDVEKYRKEKPWLHTHTFPRTWDTTIKTKTHRLVKVTKEANNEEYREISKLFKRTLPDGAITRLERVQNEICWEAFARQRETMMKKNSRRKVEELQLFHGTMQDKVDDICRDNFDFRLSGTRVGHVYGQGAYFAKSAKYSNDYAEKDSVGRKRMFVARVLVGSYTVGTKEMRRPPFKDPADKSKGMYDSCVDDVANPSIFVVFDNHQVYPEYLITYTISSHNTILSRASNIQPSSATSYPSSRTAASASHSGYINPYSASRYSPPLFRSSSSNQPSNTNNPYSPSRYSPPTNRSSSSNQPSYSSPSSLPRRDSKADNSKCICM